MNPRPTDGIAHIAGYLFSNVFYQIDFLSMMCASAKISTDRIFTTENGEVVERHFFFDIPEIAGLTIDPSVNFPEPELLGSTLYVCVSNSFSRKIAASNGDLSEAEAKLKQLRILLETQILPIETLKLKLIDVYKAIPVDGEWPYELDFNANSETSFVGIYEANVTKLSEETVIVNEVKEQLVVSEQRDVSKDFYQAETTIPVPVDITLDIKP